MWQSGWRETIWNEIDQEWDILIIGGGITGAGVFRRAVAAGLKVLLVDAGDFSCGTSSRSSKLIHGGFRYLRSKQWSVTHESVREREWLLREAKGLVTPLGCILPNFEWANSKLMFAAGVIIYDLMAPKWQHEFYQHDKLLETCPQLHRQGLDGGYLYYDAQMDDSNLVLHILRETVESGGTAINYVRAEKLLRTADGKVCGAALKDVSGDAEHSAEVKAKVVVNAAGPWCDELRMQVGGKPRIRPQRGSHLIFNYDRLPLPHAVTMLHPKDRRAMFAIPWEGTTIIGTTDLDHKYTPGAHEPFTTPEEIDYILEAGNTTFDTNLARTDIISSFAGLRPIISTGKADPSAESREHVVWEEEGLITVTGGKITTFRIMAEQAMQMISSKLQNPPDLSKRIRYFDPLPKFEAPSGMTNKDWLYLAGRYNSETAAMLDAARDSELEHIGPLPNLWAEIRWAARCGGVLHLDDLLVRRVRLGMLLPEGAQPQLERVRSIAQPELGWSDARWQEEEKRYQKIYQAYYSPEPTGREE